MKGRKFTSVGLLLTAILASITGVILLFFKEVTPHSLIGYVKHIHEWISLAFLIFIVIHTVYNIKPLTKYFSGNIFGISKEAILNFAIVIILTSLLISSVSTHNKERELERALYPSVEDIQLSLLLESSKTDYNTALKNLTDKGYIIPNEELTLDTLAKANNTKPKVLYAIMVSQK